MKGRNLIFTNHVLFLSNFVKISSLKETQAKAFAGTIRKRRYRTPEEFCYW